MMMFSSSSFAYITAVLLVFTTDAATAVPVDETTVVPITPSYQYDMYRNNLPTCFDYRKAIELGMDDCKHWVLFDHIRDAYDAQSKSDWALKWYCHGGLTRELMTLTGREDKDGWKIALDDMCAGALGTVSSEGVEKDIPWPEGVGDLNEFFAGDGILNNELGNFRNIEHEFVRRGGYDRYFYIGDDPRKNDYFPTTEESYQGGVAIIEFYNSTVETKYLEAPASFKNNQCVETNAAMCCWSGDRQYNDNNGRCGLGDCVNKAPSDNTDLCWTEDDAGKVYPYPSDKDEDERDLHCHGVSWSSLEQELGDVNNDAKWNNLFHTSMYDHLYKRGYVNSLTDAKDFMGSQAMCGCVEDMAPVARADCTEAIGTANYTVYQDQDTGLLALKYKEGTFGLEFRSCEGYEYDEDITVQDYQGAVRKDKIGLKRRTNDLSAFIYRQYLEEKTDQAIIDKYEETVVGYKYPKVNNNDEEREMVCKKAFETKFPGTPYEKVVVDEELEEEGKM